MPKKSASSVHEAYSDIWGEVVDINNNRQTDVDALRTDATCTIWSPPAARLTVNTPISIAGQYPLNTASFGPALTAAGLSGDVVLADDGVGTSSNPADADGVILTTMDACTPLTNAVQVAGKIALAVRGGCAFVDKTVNAQAAGAIGVIIMNHSGGGDVAPGMSGSNPAITITTVSVGRGTGLKLAGAQVANTVNVTAALAGGSTGLNNTRWVVGEDDPAFGGAIRDMWSPNCNSHPGRVTDAYYFCGATDSGGVHANSGVPNHGFTLLVDGGTFDGQTISGIGFVKASHIYWRAQSVYQIKNSDFKDHADAIEQSCMDLAQAGTNLNGLSFGDPAGPSGQVVTAGDCEQVAKMTQAVELRTPPAQCNFQPIFRQDVPPLCAVGTPNHILTETFESGIAAGWAISTFGVFSNALPYQWVLTNSLPPGRTGTAFFAVDAPNPDTACTNDAADGSRRMSLTSPVITIPNNIPFTMTKRLAFDHWMFSEIGFDGGNIKASVNGGPFNVVAPSAFVSNTYNSLLTNAAGGNTNPMEGERAWTGADNNNSQRTAWGQSQIDLSKIANPGDTVQLRFDFGTDGCGGADGWYVDNVQALYCDQGEPPTFETATPSVTPTSTNTPTSTRTPTNTPTQTQTPTATETPTGTPPTPTNTATATNTPVPPTCPTIDEGFESGPFPPAEWLRINNSAPVGPLGWFTTTGSSANFTSPFGIRYAGANFQSTDPAASGEINNWLLTRPFSLTNGDTFTFWTRAQGSFPDRLQVRLSTTGAGANVGTGAADVGAFTTLLTDINPSLNLVDYPTAWTQYTITLSGLPANANGRIAFRYFVTDGGGGNNSDRIGVDNVKFSGCAFTPPVVETATPTPTPTTTPTRTPQPTATPYGDACYVMNAGLSGSNEVPPSSSPGLGFGVFNVDTINNRVVYSISHSGLLSETAAHIHGFAAAGANAGVLHHLPPGSSKFGVWYYDEAQENNILNELTYVNIHNPEHPAGAIRGQIVRISVGNCALLEPVPHLNVTLSGVASGAPPAAEIEYTARLTRTYSAPLARGDAANAAAVSLIAPIPPGTTYVAGSAVPAPAVVLPGNAGLVWNVPYAQAGSGFVARYRVAVGAGVTEVSNTVTGIDGTDVATSNTVVNNVAPPTATPTATPTSTATATQVNTATPTPTATAVPPTATPTATPTRSPDQRPDLTLRKDARDNRVRPGERVVFELKYENDSDVAVTGVVIREVVPVNSKFDAAGSTTGWSCADGAAAGTVCELTIGALAAEGDGTALFAVKAVNAPIWPRVIVNLARILDDGTHGADRRPHNNYAFDIVAIRNGGGGLARGTETTTWSWEGADVTVTSNDGINFGVGVAAEGEHLGTRAVATDMLIYLPAVAR